MNNFYEHQIEIVIENCIWHIEKIRMCYDAPPISRYEVVIKTRSKAVNQDRRSGFGPTLELAIFACFVGVELK